ncbi:MAG: hypothetical protein R2764_01290 [Bacteroidales bacterium]
MINRILSLVVALLLQVYSQRATMCPKALQDSPDAEQKEESEMEGKLQQYVSVKLTSDISHLSDNEKEMLGLLFKASKIADDIFWMQNAGKREDVLSRIRMKQPEGML